MSNDKDKSTPNSAPSTSPEKPHMVTAQCTVCTEVFPNIKACLKHELLDHSLQKKKQPQNILNATTKFLNTSDKLEERVNLHALLTKCQDGQELRTIFELLCMKTDSLDLIFTRIQTCMEKELRSTGNVKIYPFGSIASGLALRDCDIDIFLDASQMNFSPRHKQIKSDGRQIQQRQAFNRINNILHRSRHFTDVFSIRGARVPIIKCKHQDTGFSIDINVSCPSSKENTQFIYELVKSDERIHELLLFLKLWAKHMQIIGKANMSSYCFITMVIFFLQQPLNNSEKNVGEDGDGDGDADGNGYVILQPVKKLQENCVPHMLQGINYAFDLRFHDNQPRIPPAIPTWNLIKEFFKFYENFNFEDNIISTFYGKPVPKTDFTPDICQEYHNQLKTISQFLEGKSSDEFKINRCMCVQDSFCLNHNVAKAMLPLHKQYFILCLQNANKICENSQNHKLSVLYEQLLYETITVNSTSSAGDFNNIELPKPEINNGNTDNPKNLICTITASKADLRTLASYDLSLTNCDELLRFWCQHYVAAIKNIIKDIYRMDMQLLSPAHQKQQKLDNDFNIALLKQSFLISTSVDLWSNRCFQKSSPFIKYQMEQTERLHQLRRQDPKFSVSLNAILTLNILPKFMGIDIIFDLPDGLSVIDLSKKSPLRKFFNMFKNTLQNYNFKDSLKSFDEKKIIGNDIPNELNSEKSSINDIQLTTESKDDISTPSSKKIKLIKSIN